MLVTQPRVHRYLAGRATDMLSTSLFGLALTWSLLEKGVSGTGIALVALTCTLSSTVLTPIAAAWIDRISRRRVLVWTKVVQIAGMTVLRNKADREKEGAISAF